MHSSIILRGCVITYSQTGLEKLTALNTVRYILKLVVHIKWWTREPNSSIR